MFPLVNAFVLSVDTFAVFGALPKENSGLLVDPDVAEIGARKLNVEIAAELNAAAVVLIVESSAVLPTATFATELL